MINDKRKEINAPLGNAKYLLWIGGLMILIMPFILTCDYFHERFNFSYTGQIGDTIGGTTAPFINLLGAILVFYALKSQVKANELIHDQIENDKFDKEYENEGNNLNQLYSYLTDSVNSFHFTTLPIEQLKNIENIETRKEFKGGDGFFHLFSQIRCHYHGTQDELHNIQTVSEVLSILKIVDLLLEKLEDTKSRNKEILVTLTKHLFDYKILTRIREESDSALELEFCNECQCYHGIPNELKKLIVEIRRKLKLFHLALS